MTQWVSMLEGAALMAAGAAIWLVGRKVWMFGHSLLAAFSGIPRLIESNQRVADRLEIVVALLSGQNPLQNLEPQAEGYTPPQQGPMPPRPNRPWDTFTPVSYEATPEETDVVDTTEAELAAYEQLEELKARGIEVEEDLDHNPPGITANV